MSAGRDPKSTRGVFVCCYSFVRSHNSQDKPRVRKLAERLRDAGLRVWLDDWVIKPGDDIYLAIERGLETARVQVLCLSPEALGSAWVTLERNTVLFRDPTNTGRRFVPLLLTDCTLPDTLRRYKHVDYRQETQAAFDEVLAACRGKEQAAPPAPQVPNEKPATRELEPSKAVEQGEPLAIMRQALVDRLDVGLSGALPHFALMTRGHVCQIQVGPIVIEPAVIAMREHPEREHEMIRIWNPRCRIEFPTVSDLRDSEQQIEPMLFYDEVYDVRRPVETGATAVMDEFLHTALLSRRGVEPDYGKLSSDELSAFMERMRQSFEVGFDITFWNSERTKQWKRREVLVCDLQTKTARVQHSGTPTPITQSVDAPRSAS